MQTDGCVSQPLYRQALGEAPPTAILTNGLTASLLPLPPTRDLSRIPLGFVNYFALLQERFRPLAKE